MSRRAAPQADLAAIRAAAPPETAILTLEQVAAWLQVGCDAVLRLGLPTIAISERQARYSVRQVLAWLERRAERAA